jgi:hypothetical protein
MDERCPTEVADAQNALLVQYKDELQPFLKDQG